MLARKEEQLKVLDFSVSEEDGVATEEMLWLFSCHDHIKRGV